MASSSPHHLSVHGYETPFLNLDGWSGEARVVDVYDGDTVQVVMRFRGVPVRACIRLLGIDTCEIRSKVATNRALAYAARNRVLSLATGTPASDWKDMSRRNVRKALDGQCAVVHTNCSETDKYGRTLANLSVRAEGTELALQETAPAFGDILVDEGLAYRYTGGKKLSEAEQTAALARNGNAPDAPE